MIQHQVDSLIETYRSKIAASRSDSEGIAHFLDLVREVAAARATADFLIFETEAQACIATEDHGALRARIERSFAEQRPGVAAIIADAADHAKDDVERGRYGRFAAEAYQMAFDSLVRTSQAGGHA